MGGVRPSEHVRVVFGVRGLVVLFALLGGFLAMHGVAATTETGVHHNPVAVLVGSQHEMPGAQAPADDDHGGAHGFMTGCLVVLLGAVAAIVLRRCPLLRMANLHRECRSPQRVRQRPIRPPPGRRSRVSLCVIRV